MHLSKPVEPDELVKVVARLAGRDSGVSAPQPALTEPLGATFSLQELS
jgi:hypothetical protein